MARTEFFNYIRGEGENIEKIHGHMHRREREKTLEVENGKSLSMEKCELARFNLHLREG